MLSSMPSVTLRLKREPSPAPGIWGGSSRRRDLSDFYLPLGQSGVGCDSEKGSRLSHSREWKNTLETLKSQKGAVGRFRLMGRFRLLCRNASQRSV